MNKLQFPILKKESICLKCNINKNCDMTELLKMKNNLIEEHGENWKILRPDLEEEFSIDEPDVDNDIVVWCPIYC